MQPIEFLFLSHIRELDVSGQTLQENFSRWFNRTNESFI